MESAKMPIETAREATASDDSLVGIVKRRADLLIGLVLLGVVAIWVGLLNTYLHGGAYDLSIYSATARGVFRGQDLYDVLPPGKPTGFTYPPFAALLLAPLGAIGATSAFVIVTAASLACGVRVAVLLGQATSRIPGVRIPVRTATLLLLTTMLLMAPMDLTIRLGQIGLILLWLATEDFLGAVPSGRRGFLIGLIAGIKLVPAFLIAALLVAGRRADALRAVIAFALTIGIGAVVNPAASWRFWSALGEPTTVGDKLGGENQSPYAFLARSLGPDTGWIVFALVVVPLAVWFLLLTRRFTRTEAPLAAFATAALGMLLLSPLSWGHYYIWTLPTIALMIGVSSIRLVTLAVLVPSLVVLSQRLYWQVPGGHGLERTWRGTQLLLGNSYVLVGFALLVWLTWYAWFSARTTSVHNS